MRSLKWAAAGIRRGCGERISARRRSAPSGVRPMTVEGHR